MNKKTTRLLGKLLETKILIWETQQHCSEEWANKLKLLDHIFKQVEEQARQFSKSKLPYISAGEFLIEGENFRLPYCSLHKKIANILLKKDTEP